MGGLLDELMRMVVEQIDEHQRPHKIAGIDALGEWYTDILGAGLAVKLSTGYISLKQQKCDEGDEPTSPVPSSATIMSERYAEGTAVVGAQGSGGKGSSSSSSSARPVTWCLSLDAALVRASRVLLCCAWVDRTEHLQAATRLLAKAGAVVVGCVAIRYDQSIRTKEFAASVSIIARSRPSSLITATPHAANGSSSTVRDRTSARKGSKSGGGGGSTAPSASQSNASQRVTRHTSTASPATLPEALKGETPRGPAAMGGGKRRRLSSPTSLADEHSPSTVPLAPTAAGPLLSIDPGVPGTARGLKVQHWTSTYEANNPTEDRHDHKVDEGAGVYAFAVLDGHGGGRASEFARQHLLPSVLEGIEPTMNNQEVVEALKKAFLSCDDAFISTLDSNVTLDEAKGWWNAGSCAVLALIRGHTLFVAHTGDCRAVLVSSPTAPQQQTKESEDGDACRSPDLVGLSCLSPSRRKSPRRQLSSASSSGMTMSSNSSSSSSGSSVSSSSTSMAHITAIALSNDHNCANQKEARIVRERTKDVQPIRFSQKDMANTGRFGAIERVAGSLAVTRALGDAYLKRKNLSFEPYKQHVPYITAEPEVSVRELDPSRDRYIILATDGLWERLSNLEAGRVVFSSMQQQQQRQQQWDTPSDALVEEVLSKVALTSRSTLQRIKKLERGTQRRSLHDDILVTVCALDFQQ